jgi:hypothetical protein
MKLALQQFYFNKFSVFDLTAIIRLIHNMLVGKESCVGLYATQKPSI